jgi:Flp pilus assembly pilin Flp
LRVVPIERKNWLFGRREIGAQRVQQLTPRLWKDESAATMADVERLPALATEAIAGFIEALVEHCSSPPIVVDQSG